MSPAAPLLLLGVVLTLAVASSPESTVSRPPPGAPTNTDKNLVPNPSFEELDGGSPRHWVKSTWGGTATFEVETSFGRTGKSCLKLSSTDGADASWSCKLSVLPMTDYRLSCWIKTESLDAATGFGAQLNLHELQMTGKTEAISGTQDWTRVESRFNSGTHKTLLLNLLYGGWGRSTGNAWFDDVELVDLTAPLPTLSDEQAASFYDQEVRPILEARCFKCHGDGKRPKGGLRLNHRSRLLRGGASGPAWNESDPRNSLILSAIRYETYEMPPDGKLPAEQIEVLTRWIRLGAPYSGTEAETPAEVEPKAHGPTVNEQTRNHWSFRRVTRPEPPVPADAEWREHPIDAFVRHGLEQAEITPAPIASRHALLRRVTYDLLGLPPTPEEVQAFVSDDAPDAWERLIERLLASPHYGEKWGRHWLDLVRYAETNSFERDGVKPFVWRYRDWVIQSFNEDKPYDRFLLEQLAGDELDGVTPEGIDKGSVIATGYYRLGLWDDEPADSEQARFDELDDIIMTTGQVILGMTINCARCHDHKLDPIPQRDYYRMLAFFRGMRRYGIRGHNTVLERSSREIATDEERANNTAAVDAHKRRLDALVTRITEIEETVKPSFEPVEHEEFKHDGARPDLVKKRIGTLIDEAGFAEYQTLRSERQRLQQDRPAALDRALCITERGPTPLDTHLLIRGNPHVAGERVEPGFPEVLGFPDPTVTLPEGGRSSGRRLALARWITSAENPLTARVMVNRIWQHHFGRGIVRTPSDFGLQGFAPTHPELLDWLAAEFIARGWSIKDMHRLILSSRTYRMSVAHDPVAAAKDPGNDRLWRFEMRRLTAEELRDSVLAVNHSLNPQMHGPSIYSAIPREVLAGQSRPGQGWGNSPPDQRARRSVYIHVKRSLVTPMLATHDAADTDFTCPVRFTTTQPTQALTMLNSEFMQEQARVFARWIGEEAGPELDDRIRLALWQTTQREPTEQDLERGNQLIADLQAKHGLNADDALHRFCLVALNLNEFVYLN